MQLYISYAPEDADEVFPLVETLHQRGYVLLEAPLTGGGSYETQLAARIAAADVFVQIQAPASLESEWCIWEFATAIELGKSIIGLAPQDVDSDLQDLVRYAAVIPLEEMPEKPATPQGEPRLALLDADEPITDTALPVVVLPAAPEPVVAPVPQTPTPEVVIPPTVPTPSAQPVEVRTITVNPLWYSLIGWGAIVLIVLIVVSAIQNRPAEVIITTTPEPSITPTETLTPTPTATRTPVPTMTPIPENPLLEQGGVVLAVNIPNLTDELTRLNVPFVRLPQTISTAELARETAANYRASLVVWSEKPDVYTLEVIRVPQTDFSRSEPKDWERFSVMNTPNLPLVIAGLVAYGQAHYDIALRRLDQAIELLPDKNALVAVPLYFWRGNVQFWAGDFTAAIEDYNRIEGLRDDDPFTYYNRGVARNQRGESEQAIADLTRVLNLRYEDAAVYYQRGNAYYSSGDFDAALLDYNRALDFDPQMASAYLNRGTTYARQGRYNEALADFNTAIAVDPNLGQAYANRGQLYRNLADYEKALADYNQAIVLNPNLPEAYLTRGIIYAEMHQYDTAIVNFNRAIVLSPNNPELYYLRGVARTFLNDVNGAEQDFQAAIQINPQYADPYATLGAIYQDTGRRDEAIAMYRQHIALAGEQALGFAIQNLQALEAQGN